MDIQDFLPISERELNVILHERDKQECQHPHYIHNASIMAPLKASKPASPHIVRQELFFIACKFNQAVELFDANISGVFHFLDCKFESEVVLHSVSNINLESKCIFNGNVSIRMEEPEYTIANFMFNANVRLWGSCNRLIIEEVTRDKGLSPVISIECRSDLIELNKVDTSDIAVRPSVDNCSLRLRNCQLSNLTVHMTKADLHISESKFDTIQFSDCKESLVQLVNVSINSLPIAFSKNCHLNLVSSKVDNLTLMGVNEKGGRVNIEDSSFKQIVFDKVENEGQIAIREVSLTKDDILSIKSSNLGKTDFINCKFGSAILDFQNSKVSECFFAEAEFPTRVRIDGKVNHSQAQLAFGQLGTAFQRQGDIVRQLEYQSREISEHFYGLRLTWGNVFQKMNLGLNFISNNFGRRWIQGLLFSFLVGVLLFSFLIWSTDEYQFGLTPQWSLLPGFFKFMNPLRFFDLDSLFIISQKQLVIGFSGWSYFWDFTGRILLAYGYYQTIQAFRRFGRK